MGRMKKKGESGVAAQYMSRKQAIKRLQLTLTDFRRLCILKGIFPRDPPNKKKLSGSSSHKTYYFTKDIKYLAHEPLIHKFRELKIFSRKLNKAMIKGQQGMADRLRKQEPKLNIDHIVRERYPSFVDALRDMDDCLCMVFLFANFPQHKDIHNETVAKCRRFAQEFMYYVILTRSLRKVFLSIKGIYYQAEIKGQTVTWIVPYKFATEVTPDIDLRVMSVFLTFYTKLLGFVNFKLFNDLGLDYPPKVDAKKLEADTGISSLVFTAKDAEAAAAVSKELARELDVEVDEFPDQMEGGDEAVQGHAQLKKKQQEVKKFTRLFDGLYFFLGREVPKEQLEFVIRSFGGNVSWEGVGGVGGGPFRVDDKRITHHIVDRPKIDDQFDGRRYVQPQWVFDCVNARQLLPTAEYQPGSMLPAHLSPFAAESDDDYIPPERKRQLDRLKRLEAAGGELGDEDFASKGPQKQQQEAEEEQEADASWADEGEGEEEQEKLEDLDDDEIHRRELEAEMRGEDLTEQVQAAVAKKKQKKSEEQAQKAKQAELERQTMTKMVMSNKTRRLYSKILNEKRQKQKKANRLASKRRAYEEEQVAKKSKGTPAKPASAKAKKANSTKKKAKKGKAAA